MARRKELDRYLKHCPRKLRSARMAIADMSRERAAGRITFGRCAAHVSARHLQRLENGKAKCTDPRLLKALAKLFEVEVEALLA